MARHEERERRESGEQPDGNKDAAEELDVIVQRGPRGQIEQRQETKVRLEHVRDEAFEAIGAKVGRADAALGAVVDHQHASKHPHWHERRGGAVVERARRLEDRAGPFFKLPPRQCGR